MNDSTVTDLDADQAMRVQDALRRRAASFTPAGPPAREVHLRVARRRRRRAAGALAIASAAVLIGLALSGRSTGTPSTSAADRPAGLPTVAAATKPEVAVPPLDAIPLPTIGVAPRDPALGSQPTKVNYTVVEGDTFETIAAKLGMDPATVRTQTGGEIKVGEVISLLVGPSVAARAAAVSTSIP